MVPTAPGLYFVGLMFMQAIASSLIGGVGKDAAYVAERIPARAAAAAVGEPVATKSS